MKWYMKHRVGATDAVDVAGPFETQQDALDAADLAEQHGAVVVDQAFQEADDFLHTWRPVAVAVVSYADGDYEIYSDDSERKL